MSEWIYRALAGSEAHLWDQQALREEGSCIYLHSLYLDDVAPGWGFMESPSGMRIPIWLRKRWGMREITHPLFVQHFRPIAQGNAAPFDLYGLLLSVEKLAHRIALQLDVPVPERVPSGWAVEERVSYRMPLEAPTHIMHAGFSSHHRRILKKKLDIQLAADEDLQGFSALFMAEMPGISGLKPKELQVVERLITWISIKKRGQLFTARHEGKIVAGCFILHSGNRLLYQWAVSNAQGKTMQAMHHLIAHVLESYAGSGLEFDFEGSMIPGLQRFYAGFGAKPYLYVRLTRNRLPFPLNRLFHAG